MTIRQFSRQFWFPSGVLAANLPARVFPLHSNALAALYTDGTGATQLPNPVTTDVNGTVSFWAEEGEYWIHIDAEVFRFSVGSPEVDLFEAVGGSVSTGVLSGGALSVNGSNPAAVDIAPLIGYVVDEVTDPGDPAVVRVDYPGGTVALDGPALLRTTTWWLMASNGTVVQQAARPSNTQKRTHLELGVTVQESGSIIVDQSTPVILAQGTNQLTDLMDALGPFTISGNHITPDGASLRINQSSGLLFARAASHYIGAVQTRDPHVHPVPAQSPAQFRYITSSATSFSPPVSTVDVNHYDLNGVVTLVTGGSGVSTIQRVWLFPANTAGAQLTIQYGQATYSSLSAAVDAIGNTQFVTNPVFPPSAALVAHIVVTRTATNLSDTTQARIFNAGKFTAP